MTDYGMSRRLTCSCWCEAEEVMVPVEWIKAGATDSCGRPGCKSGCDPRDEHQEDAAPEPAFTPSHAIVNRRKIKMSKYNPNTYTPRQDESVEIPPAIVAANPANLYLIAFDPDDPQLCGCGCGESRGVKTQFAMGHDIRLRGKLMRIGASGGKVVTLERSVGTFVAVGDPIDPIVYAAQFNTDKLDWEDNVRDGIARALAPRPSRKAAEKAVLAKAAGPQQGDKILIKVGRWDKTGSIAAIYKYDDGTDVMEVEYVDAKGNIQTARREGADSKWKVVS